MQPSEAYHFINSCETYDPDVVAWKFIADDSQLAILHLRLNGGHRHELHLHFSWNGEGVLTGANMCWPREGDNGKVKVDDQLHSRLVQFCKEYIGAGLNNNFHRHGTWGPDRDI